MKNTKIIIVGAGLAGISLAYFLKSKSLAIFEKEKEAGGLCRSQRIGKFIFDYGGHLLHFRGPFFGELIRKLLKQRMVCSRRQAFIYFRKKMVPYPFQFFYQQRGSHRVPPKEKIDYVKISNFSQWCQSMFSRDIFEYFFYPYNYKFWGVPLERLDYKWAERFVPYKKSRPLGYNWRFFYPQQGIRELIQAFLKKINAPLNLGFEIKEIDIERRKVRFANSFVANYSRLYLSLPLAELPRLIKSLPRRIINDLGKLKSTSIYVLNLGLSRKLSKFGHWIYFPQRNISFFRIGFPSNFSSGVSPRGYGSLYAEVSLASGDSINKEQLEKKIIADLVSLGIIKEKDIVERLGMFIKHAYPLPLLGKDKIVEEAEKFLSKYGIYLIGRYGRWQYYSMEDVVLGSGRLVGER